MNRDEEHLRLLSIFYYFVAGLNAVVACFFGLYFILGIGVLLMSPEHSGSPHQHDNQIAGIGLMVFGVCALLFIAALAGLNIFVGRSLSQKKRYTFCLVMASVTCVFFPLGTILGVFSLVVLVRPTVKPLFDGVVIPPAFPR